LEIIQIEKEASFLEDVYFVLEKREQGSTNLFLPRFFHEKEEAIKFIRQSKKELRQIGLDYTTKYFIFKGTSIDYS